MPGTNLTRDEAARRSSQIQTDSYRIYLDLATGSETTFVSITEIDFTAEAGASTFLDIMAESVNKAVLNGNVLDVDAFADSRFPLEDLAPNNTVRIEATMNYSRTGEGLHRYVDPADGEAYLYSQFEVADARRVFACFEQPDLKADFSLTIDAPDSWTVLSNSPSPEPVPSREGILTWQFTPTERMSTYLVSIIAGPYASAKGDVYRSVDGREIPLGIWARKSLIEYVDADEIYEVTKQGFEFYEANYGFPYPFRKYDQIFCPEYNAGAMEHPGNVTLVESYIFRTKPTGALIDRRVITILHEQAHMWFGDLVTMKWWDDLWLNESFAEWASHFAADEIAKKYGTGANPWASFSNERKAWAYLQDQLSTTHPIAADMSDLEKVEQNFDGITYAKGASVLKLLVSFVGIEAFLKGVGNYFRKFAYGNTTLTDLLTELQAASGRDLSWFAGQWLESAGVNTLRAEFEVDETGTFTRFAVVQTAPEGWPTLRTHRLGIGIYASTEEGLERVDYVETDISGERTEVPELVGHARRDVVLLNDGDLTFAKIRLDEVSRNALVAGIDKLADPLARAVTWSLFWDSVRDAEIAPQEMVSLALQGIGSEKDMAAITTVLAQAAACSGRFMAPELREAANTRLVTGLAGLLKDAGPGSDAQLIIAKTLIGTARSDDACELIRGWLHDEEVPTDLAVDTEVRWLIVTTLARRGVFGEPEIAAELERDNTNTGAERAAGARAGIPTAEAKAEAWRLATADPDVPNETHRSIAMGFINFGQDEVLRPYVDSYAELASLISRREGGWENRGYAAIGAALRWLFPETLVSSDLVARFRRYLAEGEPSDQVRRLLSERLDEAERSLRVQERSRH